MLHMGTGSPTTGGSQGAINAATPELNAEQLTRILDAFEEGHRKRWLEIPSALLLALATMTSAWCAYQAARWGGVQIFQLAEASKAARDATAQTLEALQFRSADSQVALAYTEARGRGDEKLAEFLLDRFRPEARRAIDAWLKTDPFNNSSAPHRPFEMAEYVQQEVQEAKRLDEDSAKMLDAAHQASHNSDRYVLLTVLLASVLFFGGIVGTFRSHRLRLLVFSIAVSLFVVTVIVLGTVPICRV